MWNDCRVSFLKNILFLLWLGLCLGVFILYPGQVSYVYWADLKDWQLLPEKLTRLDWIDYLINLIGSFFGAAIYFITCTSLGLFVTQKYKITDARQATTLSKLANVSITFIIGNGLLSVVFLTIAGIGQLTPLTGGGLLLAGFLLGVRGMFRIQADLIKRGLPQIEKPNLLLWLSAGILFLSLLQSSARISYDSTAIYFSDAKITALSHHVQYFTDGTFVASVFQSSIQSTVLIQLFGDQAARMFTWMSGIVVIILSLALGEKLGLSKQAGLILLACLLTSTAFTDLMGDGKVDIISSAIALTSVYVAVISGRFASESTMLWIGFLAGYASVARPFNAFLLAIFLLVFYFQQAFFSSASNNLELFAVSLFWVGLGAMGWGIYYLFSNWMITGDPLSFLSSISAINPSTGPWDASPNQTLFFRIFYPFITAFRNTPQSLGNISPLFIGFFPVIFSTRVRRTMKLGSELTSITLAATVAILMWVWFAFTVVEVRYVLFVWIILFIPIAEMTATFLETKTSLNQITTLFIISLLAFICVRIIFISIDTYAPLDKNGNPQCFDHPYCESISSINRIASPGDRVLMLTAYRYYLRTDLFACSTTHEEYNNLQKLLENDIDLFWREVYRKGYKFIATDRDYAIRHLRFRLTPSTLNTPTNWLELKYLFGNDTGQIAAYEIDFKSPPVQVEYHCVKNSVTGIWETKKIP